MHARIVHQIRSEMRRFIPIGLTRCPVCGTDFRERHRLVAHISDSRRRKCADQIHRFLVPLCGDELDECDLAARAERRAARQQGHTHPIAALTALRSDGRPIGRAA